MGQGNRKDIRNAVEAAHKAAGWARATAHVRAQVLYYLAENLAARAEEFAGSAADVRRAGTQNEVALTIERMYTYAAWADKYDGAVHHTPYRNVTLAMPEPIGVLGVVAPGEWPLLGFVSAVLPAVALGNTVVAIPSAAAPLAATDLYQVLETSDVPDGVINIVTGDARELGRDPGRSRRCGRDLVLRDAETGAEVERLSAGNMKRTWVDEAGAGDWTERGARRGRRVPGAGHSGQEHLDSVRRVKQFTTEAQRTQRDLAPRRPPSR